ncbi:hypothetical protein [Natrinema versiforme]|uniref:Uncharacterized protein n=1 Tax=Natrinema versiforme JCM 10478 TaxID=1227496 RepID=L9Y220_9EURY|nr:hypothetical protein [Natrinema versiforme]ELY67772.1 hypothetical protein C489_09436 [Natrinema versiforme JCM 10478]
MQFKPVPDPPADLERLETVRRALPADAGEIDDCCQHLIDETPLETRDEAGTWLTFLRALELAAEEPVGFRRRGPASSGDADSPALDRDRLGQRFRDRVYGADAALAVLERADEPLPTGAVADALGDDRSSSERRSRPNGVSEDRVERLLGWAALLGVADRVENGYRLAPVREKK